VIVQVPATSIIAHGVNFIPVKFIDLYNHWKQKIKSKLFMTFKAFRSEVQMKCEVQKTRTISLGDL
jgi:hypothetical protein